MTETFGSIVPEKPDDTTEVINGLLRARRGKYTSNAVKRVLMMDSPEENMKEYDAVLLPDYLDDIKV